MNFSIAGVVSQAEIVIEQYLSKTADLERLQKEKCEGHEAIELNERYQEHCRDTIKRLGNIHDAAEVLRAFDPHNVYLVKFQAKQYADLK